MPDFSPQSVHDFWHAYDDETIYKVVAFMESVEDWTFDGDPDVEDELLKFGRILDEVGSYELGQEALFIDIANHVKTGRALRLMQAIDTANPGAASKLLVHAEDASNNSNDAAGLFLRRNVVFERLRLLSRVFSDARLKLVVDALQEEEDAF